jgi:hypothetical protein
MSLYDQDGRVLISPSRLKTWLDCPLKWKAVYVDEIRSPATPSLVFGTAIHRALEVHHRSRWLGGENSAEELEAVFREAVLDACREDGLDPLALDLDEFTRQAKLLIDAYRNTYGNERVSAAELSLAAPIVDAHGELGAQLVGVIDLVTDDRRVVDIKSSARSADLFDLTVAHSIQLDAYRWLVLHSTGEEPTAMELRVLLRRKNPEIQTYTLPTRRGFGPFLELVKAYVAFVRNAHPAIPRTGMFCGASCPAYAACRLHHGLEVA